MNAIKIRMCVRAHACVHALCMHNIEALQWPCCFRRLDLLKGDSPSLWWIKSLASGGRAGEVTLERLIPLWPSYWNEETLAEILVCSYTKEVAASSMPSFQPQWCVFHWRAWDLYPLRPDFSGSSSQLTHQEHLELVFQKINFPKLCSTTIPACPACISKCSRPKDNRSF